MRLWSLHPRYLDSRGLVALWREALLAQAVLRGKTRGYRHHPQLARFQAMRDPVAAIGAYLSTILDEAASRGYCFDGTKIAKTGKHVKVRTTRGQLDFEFRHLLKKLWQRDPARFRELKMVKRIAPNPVITIIPGKVESWERVN